MSQPSDEMNPMADSLRGLVPAAPALSRDRLLFEAGRASVYSPWAWLWKVAALSFGGLSLSLGYAFVSWSPATIVVERERIVEAHSTGSKPAPEPAPPLAAPPEKPALPSPPVIAPTSTQNPEAVAMLRIRNEVLRWGPEMLPPAPIPDQRPHDDAKELDRWLGVPPRTFTAPYTMPRFIPKFTRED